MAFDWKSAVGVIAPGIATLLGGPLAGGAVKLLADSLLDGGSSGDHAKDEASLANALAGGITPEIRAKIIDADTQLKLASMTFADAAQARELETLRVQLTDAQSARERDKEYVKAGHYNARADILAFLSVAGLLVCLWFVVRDSSLPESARSAVMFVAGVFASAVRDVFSFEFGSSRGSKEKDTAITDALNKR
jgi:hypothetical protein